MRRGAVAAGLVLLFAVACGREAPPPRDWREAPFEPVADASGAVYATVIERGLARLSAMTGDPYDDVRLYVRPRLAEQGQFPIPRDIREATAAHLGRAVRWANPVETDGAQVVVGPIVLRGTDRHVHATLWAAGGEQGATYVLADGGTWRIVGIKDTFEICGRCPSPPGFYPVP